MNNVKLILSFVLIIVFYSCNGVDSITFSQDLYIWENNNYEIIEEENNPNLTIHEGCISNKKDTIRFVSNGETNAIILLDNPKIVAQAEKEEDWGFFQFPKLYRDFSGNLIIKWQMKEDSHTVYGVDGYGRVMSKDEGASWATVDDNLGYSIEQYKVYLKNGELLQVKNPTSKDILSYGSFPPPVNEQAICNINIYKESELPDELRGVYFELLDGKSNTVTPIHAVLDDDGLLRYAIENLMPIVWWGDIKEEQDGSLVAGVYGSFYQNTKKQVLKMGITFYKSENRGYSWKAIGRIPYVTIEGGDYETFVYDGDSGFSEPTFEILEDGTYICIMRNRNWSVPLCVSYSTDKGYNWTRPVPITPNGVKPRLLKLNKELLVLASGRPGLQLRFSFSNNGEKWSEPIEMMPFVDEEGNIKSTRETCGYADLLKVDDQTFYLVYSDFTTLNQEGERRKSIIFRKIKVIQH